MQWKEPSRQLENKNVWTSIFGPGFGIFLASLSEIFQMGNTHYYTPLLIGSLFLIGLGISIIVLGFRAKKQSTIVGPR